jgi:hypothetical protein
MLRTGVYALVAANGQPMLAMQSRARRECTACRGWTVSLQVPEISFDAVEPKARERLIESRTPPRNQRLYWCARWIDEVRSVAGLLAILSCSRALASSRFHDSLG